MEINCLECAADDVMSDAWELLHDDCNERPRARPRPSSPHIQHQSLAMRPTLGRDPGKLLGFDINIHQGTFQKKTVSILFSIHSISLNSFTNLVCCEMHYN